MEEIEIEAVNTFAENIKNYHQECIILKCALVLDETMPWTGASPDRLTSCSCYGKACIEIKCWCLINYTKPSEQNLHYSYKDGDTVKLKQNHKYFTQCLMQMVLTKTKTAYFLVCATHGMVIGNITFDKELWESMKSNFGMFYKEFYLNTLFSE